MLLSPPRVLGRSGAFLVLAVSLAAVGCGPSSGAVTGKVTYKDAPLKGGRVHFTASDGKAYSSEIADDGTYTVDKVPVGEAKVSVETSYLNMSGRTPAYKPPPGTSAPPGAIGNDPEAMRKKYVKIPDNYEDPEASKLTYTVKPGAQHYDIPLN